MISLKEVSSRPRIAALLRTFVGSLSIRLGGQALTLLTTLFLTNRLGADVFGHYAYSLSIATLISLVLVLGGDIQVLRSVSSAAREGTLAEANVTIRFALSAFLLLSLVLLLLTIPSAGYLSSSFGGVENLVLAAVLAIVFAGLRISLGFNRGLQAPVIAQVPDLLVRRIVFLLLMVLPFAAAMSSTQVLRFHVIASLVALGFAGGVSRSALSKIPGSLSLTGAPFTKVRSQRSMWRSSMELSSTTVLQAFVAQFPIVFLGYFGTASDVAVYAVALRVAGLFNLLLISVNMSVAGRISTGSSAAEPNVSHESRKAAPLGTLVAFVVALPGIALCLLFPSTILGVFGEEFRTGSTVLRILVGAYAVHIAGGPVGIFLQMSFRERLALKVSVSMFFFSLAASGILSSTLGVEGAALSFALSFVSYKLVLLHLLRRDLGVDPSILGVSQALKKPVRT